MKSIILNSKDVTSLLDGKLKVIQIPLVEHRDDSGMTFSEACEHYKKYRPSPELMKQLAARLGNEVSNEPIITYGHLGTEYEPSKYSIGEELLPYSGESTLPISRPLRIKNLEMNERAKRCEMEVEQIG
jgi:hypothetical protein